MKRNKPCLPQGQNFVYHAMEQVAAIEQKFLVLDFTKCKDLLIKNRYIFVI